MNKDRKARLLELLTKDPKAPFLLFALAKEYEAGQNTLEAIRIYNQLLSVDPNYTGAYYHLGKQYEQLSDVQQAIQTLKYVSNKKQYMMPVNSEGLWN
jgi:tetratricopeptide (TPR) repeat protein